MSSECKWCKAKVMWVETEAGKRMPLNSGPDREGNVVMVGHTGKSPIVKVYGNPAEIPAGTRRYKSHFATCTNPGKFRRQKLSREGARR